MKKMIMQAKEQGWEITAGYRMENGKVEVIVRRDPEKIAFPDRPYSTHTWDNVGFYNGKYDMTMTEAMTRFAKRISE